MQSQITPLENWRPIVGWEDWYEASDLGRIRSTRDRHGLSRYLVLAGGLTRPGYRVIALKRNGRVETISVHSMVARAFLGPCPEGMEIDHRDGNKLNCRLDNLEYVTHAENQRRSSNAKLTAAIVAEIRSASPYRGLVTDLARRHGVSSSVISRIRGGTRKVWVN